MPELHGFFSISIVALFTIFLCVKQNSFATVLCLAFTIRIIILMMNYNGFPLPETSGDQENFENQAWIWSQGNFIDIIKNFTGPDPYFISWIVSILYFFTDRSILMAQSLSLFFGMGTIYICMLATKEIFNEKNAIKLGFILAFFPTLILYSCLFLRESFSWFFLGFSILYIVKWLKSGGVINFSLAIGGFLFLNLFHGALTIGGFVFMFYVFMNSLKTILIGLPLKILNCFALSSIILIFILLGLIVSETVQIDKLRILDLWTNPEFILEQIKNLNEISRTSFPEFLIPETFYQLIYLAPLKIIYFIISPLPWNINSYLDFLGFIDSLFYIILFVYLFTKIKIIWSDPTLKLIFIIMMSYLCVFGISIGNYGSAIRHRTKIFIILIILVIDKIPRLVWKKSKNYNN